MQPRSKTDLRRHRPLERPAQPAPPQPPTGTGPAEEALLFGKIPRAEKSVAPDAPSVAEAGPDT